MGTESNSAVVQYSANAVVGVLSILKFPVRPSRVSYNLGTEWTTPEGQTKLTRCVGEEIWLCKMSRHSSRAGMDCDSCQCTSSLLSGSENVFQGLIIMKPVVASPVQW